MLSVLLDNILPIFIVVTLGFLLRRRLQVDKRSLSSVVFNGLSPCLVFSALINSGLSGAEFSELFLFTVALVAVMGTLAFLVGRFLRYPRPLLIALMLTVMFANSGNFGLTLVELRYGGAGLARGIVYYVTSTILVYTVGVFLATLRTAPDWRLALRRLTRIPAVYATGAAIVVFTTGLQLPGPLLRGVEIAGGGAIPVMLIILGANLADLGGWADVGSSLRLALPGSLLRLLVAPLVGLGLTVLLGIEGQGRAVAVIDAALPTAVITTILATEFDVEPAAVTGMVVLSTLLSPVTVSFVISALNL